MLEMSLMLGRDVPTTQQVLEVIRSELRTIRYNYIGMMACMRDGWLVHDGDFNLTYGGDEHAQEAVFKTLCESALGNVKDWARDEGLVFDESKVKEFIRQALLSAEGDTSYEPALPGGMAALAY